MKAIYLNKENVAKFEEGLAVAIGYFDGFHIGHQLLIDEVLAYGEKYKLKTAVITFNPNPSYKLGLIKDRTLITPIPEKERIIDHTNVDYLLIINFDDEVMNMSKEEFINRFIKGINTKYLVCGKDWRFGKNGSGNTSNLIEMDRDFEVSVIDLLEVNGRKVSSTDIKSLIKDGLVTEVNQLLGRPFALKGEVIHGNKRGREIGFPTANILVDKDYIIPGKGVYIGEVKADGKWYHAMINIGNNPTFNNSIAVSVEAYILDFNSNIYGENVRVNFLKRIRNEQKFNGIESLIEQLNSDLNQVKTFFETYTYKG